MQTPGVAALDTSSIVSLKEAVGAPHEGKGVRVVFHEGNEEMVAITVYPIIYFGNIIPEVAWSLQELVKSDVEKFTGLMVEAVHVHVKGVVTREGDKK